MLLEPVVRDEYSVPFFEAAAKDELLLRYSPSRETWSEPSALVCATTQATDLEWRAASGQGTLISWTIKAGRSRGDTVEAAVVVGKIELGGGTVISWTIKPDSTRGDTVEAAVVLGIIELDEGPWLSVKIADADPQRLQVGLRSQIKFEQPENSDYQPVAQLL